MAVTPITPIRIARKLREPRIVGDIAYIPLSDAKPVEAIIDAVDVPLIAGRNWGWSSRYVRTVVYLGKGKRDKQVFLHRHITGALPDEDVDHIDGDGLNNRRANLRRCTHAQNGANRPAPSSNKSGYKGVSFCRQTGRYRAILGVDGKKFRAGRFDTAEEAARAYDALAKEKLGAFAYLNFRE